MRFYKHAFTVSDASKKPYLKALEATADMVRAANQALGPCADALLFEEFGHSLIQHDWSDETGFYMVFRIAPLDASRAKVREAATELVEAWKRLFRDVRKSDVSHDAETDRFTVAVFTAAQSIGD